MRSLVKMCRERDVQLNDDNYHSDFCVSYIRNCVLEKTCKKVEKKENQAHISYFLFFIAHISFLLCNPK